MKPLTSLITDHPGKMVGEEENRWFAGLAGASVHNHGVRLAHLLSDSDREGTWGPCKVVVAFLSRQQHYLCVRFMPSLITNNATMSAAHDGIGPGQRVSASIYAAACEVVKPAQRTKTSQQPRQPPSTQPN